MNEKIPPLQPTGKKPPPHLSIGSQALFCGQQEIQIIHEGHAYRLRITRQNKLILTK